MRGIMIVDSRDRVSCRTKSCRWWHRISDGIQADVALAVAKFSSHRDIVRLEFVIAKNLFYAQKVVDSHPHQRRVTSKLVRLPDIRWCETEISSIV